MSELALQLIAENKKSKATFLDLGNCGLTALPDEVSELVWLESLSLASEWGEWTGNEDEYRVSKNQGDSNKGLGTITAVATLIHLKSFSASETLVSDLTPLAGLVALQSLSISSTQINDLTPLAGLV
jgi:internalin A